jgi:hypothetical protein
VPLGLLGMGPLNTLKGMAAKKMTFSIFFLGHSSSSSEISYAS